MVVKESIAMPARTEIEIDATPEEVWDALATEEGREAWLDDDREVHVEAVDAPRRMVWWWWEGDQASRVEIRLEPAVSSTRVIVTESVPAFPLVALAGMLTGGAGRRALAGAAHGASRALAAA